MEILIITGLSGSGKSKAASVLEDIGYYIVDNLPAEMMIRFARFCTTSQGKYDKIAFVYDIRTGEPADKLFEALTELKNNWPGCKVLFLDSNTDVIIHRYKETRRNHPLAKDGVSIEVAVALEREFMAQVEGSADIVLNTSAFSSAKLRSVLLNMFGSQTDKNGLHVSIMSFGFKHGLPLEADIVWDVRFLPNPYYDEKLRYLTGLDMPVQDYLISYPETNRFMDKIEDMMSYLLPLYQEEGKSMLVIAVGCTGGHHRSVAVTHIVAERIAALGYTVTETHRDISR